MPHKAAILLGDLRAKKAVPALTARLHQKARGDEHRSALIALGYIATPPAVDAILADLKDAKADPAERASAADALYLSGDRRAVPTLLEVAKSGYVMNSGGQKAVRPARQRGDRAARASPARRRYDAFKALVDKETEAAQGVFGMALDRMQVAKECGDDLACYGKKLNDPSWTRAEKAAFAIALLGQRQAGAAAAARGDEADHHAWRRSATRCTRRSCSRWRASGRRTARTCIDKLDKQIERDEKAVRIPGARDLLGETRVTEAIIQNQGAERRRPQTARPPTAPPPRRPPPAARAKGKRGKRRRRQGQGRQEEAQVRLHARPRSGEAPVAQPASASGREARAGYLLRVLGDDRRRDPAAHVEHALDARAPRARWPPPGRRGSGWSPPRGTRPRRGTTRGRASRT